MLCEEILAESQITDIDEDISVEITRSAGQKLLKHFPQNIPMVDERAPFTPALGLRIAPKAYPHFEGNAGLYLREGGEYNRVLLMARLLFSRGAFIVTSSTPA